MLRTWCSRNASSCKPARIASSLSQCCGHCNSSKRLDAASGLARVRPQDATGQPKTRTEHWHEEPLPVEPVVVPRQINRSSHDLSAHRRFTNPLFQRCAFEISTRSFCNIPLLVLPVNLAIAIRLAKVLRKRHRFAAQCEVHVQVGRTRAFRATPTGLAQSKLPHRAACEALRKPLASRAGALSLAPTT